MNIDIEQNIQKFREKRAHYNNNIIATFEKQKADEIIYAIDNILNNIDDIDEQERQNIVNFSRSLDAFMSTNNSNTQTYLYENALIINNKDKIEQDNMPFHFIIENILNEYNSMLDIETITNEIIKKFPNKFQTLKETPQKIVRNELEKKSINSNLKEKSNDIKFFKNFDNNKYGLFNWLTLEDEKYLIEYNTIPERILNMYGGSNNLIQDIQAIKEKLNSAGDIQKLVLDAKKNEGVFENKIKSFEETSELLAKTLEDKILNYQNEIDKKHKDLDLIIQSIGANDAYNLYNEQVRRLTFANRWFLAGLIFALIVIFGIGYNGYALIPQDIQKLINEHSWMIIGYRIILMAPLFAFVSFMWNNYSQNKKLLEDYNHKKIVALTLMSNFNIIRTQTNLDDQKSFEVLFASVGNMLENPVKNAFKNNQSGMLYSIDDLLKIVKISKD